MEEKYCREHSGCIVEIENLKKSDVAQWACLDYIKNRMNIILGGVILSLIALLGNILFRLIGKI